MMPHFWMVRAGEGGHLASEFADKGVVAIGWPAVGSLAAVASCLAWLP
jgi:predicted Mrr-cat superfamily restriction endonuclease